jgi:hypothetical protein
MVPGFAFTVFGYWYPTWVDRSIPESADSRIWMLVAFTLRYTMLAAASVVIAYVESRSENEGFDHFLLLGSGPLCFCLQRG